MNERTLLTEHCCISKTH